MKKANNKDFTLKEIEKINAANRMSLINQVDELDLEQKQSEETGQKALRLSKSFHEKVLLIKKHLESKIHPIAKLMNEFKKLYSL